MSVTKAMIDYKNHQASSCPSRRQGGREPDPAEPPQPHRRAEPLRRLDAEPVLAVAAGVTSPRCAATALVRELPCPPLRGAGDA